MGPRQLLAAAAAVDLDASSTGLSTPKAQEDNRDDGDGGRQATSSSSTRHVGPRAETESGQAANTSAGNVERLVEMMQRQSDAIIRLVENQGTMASSTLGTSAGVIGSAGT